MAKLDKYTEGFFLGLNDKNWKYLKTTGVSPEEYLILSHIHRLNNLIPDDEVMKRFSPIQQKSYKQNGRTTGYIDAFQIMQDVKKAKTIGKLFDDWGLNSAEKGAAIGMIAAVNQDLQNISGLAETALRINTLFRAGGTAAKAAPHPWAKVAGYAIVALSTILPFVLNKDKSDDFSDEEFEGEIEVKGKKPTLKPPIPEPEPPKPEQPKQPKKPEPKKETPLKPAGRDWFAPVRKAIIPAGAATGLYKLGEGAGKGLTETGKAAGKNIVPLVLGGLAIYFVFKSMKKGKK